MATPEQKPFCVLQFVKHESVISVQQAFWQQFNSDPPSTNSIRHWYQQFQTRGAFVKEKVQDSRVLIRVWQELDYRLDVCRVTKDAYIKHLWTHHKFVQLFFHHY
jgi:hypothetical protein